MLDVLQACELHPSLLFQLKIQRIKAIIVLMTVLDIKAKLHERIERLTDTQLKKLYSLFIEFFPEKKKKTAPRQLGRLPGLIVYMAPDFDEPLEDFNDYMPE